MCIRDRLTTVNAGKVYDGQPLEAAAASATDIHGGTVLIEYSVDGIKWTTDNTSITITDAVDMTIQVRASGKNYDGYVTGEQKLVITRRPILITGTGWQEKQPYTCLLYTSRL